MRNLLLEDERERYDAFRLRSFVENNAKVRSAWRGMASSCVCVCVCVC
jgi:hypothetical protein